MVVYGHGKSRYELTTAVTVDCDGTVYAVKNNPSLYAKVYERSYRNDEIEQKVINAANGTSSMLKEFPIDVLYQHGKFAGYTFEDYTMGDSYGNEDQPSETQPKAQHGYTVIGSIASAAVMSILIYFLIFPMMSGGMNSYVRLFCAHGFTLIIVGWIAMLLFLTKGSSQIDSEGVAILAGALSYVIGAVLCCGLIYALVTVVSLAYSIIVAVLPTLIVIGIIVYVLKKYVFRR